MSASSPKQTRSFQTEVKQLLDLMIHSLYGNKEVFLRELISNASDALDKLRYQAISNDQLYEGDTDLAVEVAFDATQRTITVTDNGVGMDEAEVVTNIGTIARSGTKEFLNSLTGDQAKDANLIGQFGVGFYSSFIVADRVTLTTRRAGSSQAVRWESTGEGDYTLETVDYPRRGTQVVLHLREEEGEFLDEWRIKGIIRKFSDHVSWPIRMEIARRDDKGEPDGTERSQINKGVALWNRSRQEITPEEYNEFYKHLGHDYRDPLAHVHARLEGKYEFTLLLYLPANPPFDLWDRDRKHGVKLYVRRVFIMEGAEELVPRYLRFLRGMVDSSDLPLNISRELLQQNKAVEAIRKGILNKTFDLLQELIDKEPDKFRTFWQHFGMVLKEGVIEDFENRARVAKLLRFASTHTGTPEPSVALSDYLGRMKEGQEKIYYAVGESYLAAANSPHLEIFRKKGIEVLLLFDRIDEWVVNHLHDFEGKALQAVAKGDLDLGTLADQSDQESAAAVQDHWGELVKKISDRLGEEVKEVRISRRLTDSAACLVGDEHDMSPAMEHLLKSAGQEVPTVKRVLEINPDHPLVSRLKEEADRERFDDWSRLLLDQAILSEGGQLKQPVEFVKRLNSLLLALPQ